MDAFKLSKDAKIAFQERVDNKILPEIEEHPRTTKEEIKSELESNFEYEFETNISQIKQENFKTEYEPFEVNSDPKHDITGLLTESIKDTSSNREINSDSIQKPKNFNKHKSGMKRKSQLEKAIDVHQYLAPRCRNSLTQRQLDSLRWAESVIMNRAPPKPVETNTPIIEITDESNSTTINEHIQLIPDTYQLAIVDFASPGGRYSFENSQLIEQTLSKAVVNYILENPGNKHPIFGKSVYHDGVLVLDCKDQTTYDFAKLVLWDIKLWDGSNLKIIEPQNDAFDSIGTLHVPDVGVNKNKVLEVLKAQNPSVNMTNWKMLGETRFTDGRIQYSIKICNPPVYFQKHKQLRLFFGGSEVVLKLYGCEWLWNCKV